MRLLTALLLKGNFIWDVSIEHSRRRYVEASNPLPLFIVDYCVENESEEFGQDHLGTQVNVEGLIGKFNTWLTKKGKKTMTRLKLALILLSINQIAD